MISLYESDITKILPEALANDPRTQALGYAINKAMQRFLGYCQNISVYTTIDTLPEEILDLLAVELNTQYYDAALSIRIKRSLIKNTLVWYMYTGTPAAVTELVKAVFGDGEIEEWFEYGGEPYHFKIYTSNINTTDEMLEQVTTLVGNIQNVRSHLEEVIVEVMQRLPLYHSCVTEVIADCTTIGIDMDMGPEPDIDPDAQVNTFVLLTDVYTGILHQLSVIDGKLMMEKTTRTDAEPKQFILFSDVSTKENYMLTVNDGELIMSRTNETSADIQDSMLFIDSLSGTLYVLNVVDGELIMKRGG